MGPCPSTAEGSGPIPRWGTKILQAELKKKKERERERERENAGTQKGLFEGGNRQNRLHIESRTPSWAGLWTLSYMPSIYGKDIPTGKPGPLNG